MTARLSALALVLLLAAPLARAEVPKEAFEDYREVFTLLGRQHADAIVTVKFVMSVTNSGNEQRIEDRTQAVLVSADGLLLVPERTISLDFSSLGEGGQGAPVATSRDFRVRLADGDEWLPADLVTRDSALGLAWLRMRDVTAPLPFVDLARGVRAEPGMVYFSVLRTSDEWGGVPVFRPGLVLGETHTPTFRLLVDGVPGLAFSHDGRPMGYVDVDLASMMRTRNTGVGLDMADLVLRMTPIDKVAAATAQAAKLPVAGAD
ncbi:hypothetical protein [Arenimonas caeni]|jgi:hypothetical protein|uniref:Serine protease n=1 Tax=Arenimonas caeni TaxID=2058085 RepID=A0A2P6M5T1_9GAMM|nr:hypothetical protein [Arenimonas caeni]MDY0021578.1 hypothetical protein [Arenimonas caeni]PRH81361.1 hypothetical protein C6N40_12995 [Arenimonas caeni]